MIISLNTLAPSHQGEVGDEQLDLLGDKWI